VIISAWKGVITYYSFKILFFTFKDFKGSELNEEIIFYPPFKNVSNILFSKTLFRLKREDETSSFRPTICFGGY
jgi:hypothetical protein